MRKYFKQVIRKLGKTMFPVSNIFADQANQEKYSPFIKAQQVDLFTRWRRDYKAGNPLPELNETGFRVFSQLEEDGLLLYIFSILGMGQKRFVDLGAADGINSNCANLAINWGWHGLFVDGDEQQIERGKVFYATHPDTWLHPPIFCCNFIKSENINEIIRTHGFVGEIDFLNIDIDGNDYWVWEAIEVVNPRVVMIETHVEFGKEPIVVPYNADYSYPPAKNPQYFGAGPAALEKLAKRKGYRLIGSNDYGFNTIYIREDISVDVFPAVTVDTILRHPRNEERQKLFEPIKSWEYVHV